MREKYAKWTTTINQKQKQKRSSTYGVQFQINHRDDGDGADGDGYGKERVNDQFQRQWKVWHGIKIEIEDV